MPDERKTPYLRIETDGTSGTTRLFVGGRFRPLVQRIHLTVGPDTAPPLLETQEMVADYTRSLDKIIVPGGPSRWVIESNSYNDTHILKDGVDISTPLHCFAVEFVCEVDGRTALTVKRAKLTGRAIADSLLIECDERGTPTVIEETLFEHWPKKTA